MKSFFAFLFIFFITNAMGQNDIVLLVKSISYKKDKVQFDQIRSIEFKAAPNSGIIEIGKTSSRIFGIQVEVLKTEVFKPGEYVAAVIFYQRVNGEWEKIVSFGHSVVFLEEQTEKPALKGKTIEQLGGYSTGTQPDYEFDIKCSLNYFKNR